MSSKPLLLIASKYVGIELLKTFSADAMSDIPLAINFASCFRTNEKDEMICWCKKVCCQIFYMASRYMAYLN